MSIEERIDDLIEAGWGVLNSHFDPGAFQRWRQRAFDCLAAMFGPDHVIPDISRISFDKVEKWSFSPPAGF